MADILTSPTSKKTLKILLISFYYPPDLSAGSFRMEAMVKALQRRSAAQGLHLEIDVLTTTPNRYSEIAISPAGLEERPSLHIHRIALPSHTGGIKDQSRAFLSYARQALRLSKGQTYDLVFGTSSRLMSAALAAQIARRSSSRLYLDIRDIFTETMQDVFVKSVLRHVLGLFRFIERRTFRQAERISINSPGFAAHIAQVAPNVGVKVFTNGIDPDFLTEDFSKSENATATLPSLLYAGNIGEGQGLEKIIPALAKRFAGRMQFRIIGNGGRRAALEQALQNVPQNSVTLSPAMAR
ncbi:MAG: glycosyltransferase, partial [Planktotalea sp.]|uniref:glycosyltransferase n=1 Tax=Planktotalea sp. TaxID=2029877 RepID=UPI003C71F8A7